MTPVIISQTYYLSFIWLVCAEYNKEENSALESYEAYTVSCYYKYVLLTLFDQLRSCRHL